MLTNVGINVLDHDTLFAQISLELRRSDADTAKRRKQNYVTLLQSKDCPNLKAMMKNMIEQFLEIERGTEEDNEAEEMDNGKEDEWGEEVGFIIFVESFWDAWNITSPIKISENLAFITDI